MFRTTNHKLGNSPVCLVLGFNSLSQVVTFHFLISHNFFLSMCSHTCFFVVAVFLSSHQWEICYLVCYAEYKSLPDLTHNQ